MISNACGLYFTEYTVGHSNTGTLYLSGVVKSVPHDTGMTRLSCVDDIDVENNFVPILSFVLLVIIRTMMMIHSAIRIRYS